MACACAPPSLMNAAAGGLGVRRGNGALQAGEPHGEAVGAAEQFGAGASGTCSHVAIGRLTGSLTRALLLSTMLLADVRG